MENLRPWTGANLRYALKRVVPTANHGSPEPRAPPPTLIPDKSQKAKLPQSLRDWLSDSGCAPSNRHVTEPLVQWKWWNRGMWIPVAVFDRIKRMRQTFREVTAAWGSHFPFCLLARPLSAGRSQGNSQRPAEPFLAWPLASLQMFLTCVCLTLTLMPGRLRRRLKQDPSF